ncbi:MAG TPA: GNAT family N-acetyltransferase [Sulfuricurvum sp.]|nr:MAG: GNAT family N-acetyltransferase [Campylobacterales bacterium 16-40-21]OZA03915.1 MAG: GNAT family N-acetyltransferase [Sulfuricurvum sp. 17-40-25]HQS65556.1 GNAT family N-acetyltransferase [Sulfuricurvum sp.]HQT37693.1 GNAT family N-acetyltransferase [Sulfuricurvum sp.]
MIFRHATIDDIETLTSLLNRSYRGESSRAGWTSEADLLSGKRIDEAGLFQLFNDPDSLILIAQTNEIITATIHAHRKLDSVHFGLFAVEPTLQGNGIGKAMLSYAESEANHTWKINTAIMEVITHRVELIEYYERRGYKRTGEVIPFPKSDLWDIQVDSLEFAILSKEFKSIYS